MGNGWVGCPDCPAGEVFRQNQSREVDQALKRFTVDMEQANGILATRTSPGIRGDVPGPASASLLDDVAPMREGGLLTAREVAAMHEFRRLLALGESMGTRRIVSMQGLERAGLVSRVSGPSGLIANWQLTPDGERWGG